MIAVIKSRKWATLIPELTILFFSWSLPSSLAPPPRILLCVKLGCSLANVTWLHTVWSGHLGTTATGARHSERDHKMIPLLRLQLPRSEPPPRWLCIEWSGWFFYSLFSSTQKEQQTMKNWLNVHLLFFFWKRSKVSKINEGIVCTASSNTDVCVHASTPIG